jgi:uncharacterized membrane protein
MSTIQQPAKRPDAAEQTETKAPLKRGSLANFFDGMGSVLELFPSGEIVEAKEPQEAIDEAFQRVNLALWAAFERLSTEFEEHQPMPSASKFSLPPPDVLERYKQIAADFPERLLAMAEKDLRLRRQMEMESQRAQFADRKLGQIFGFAIGLVAILAGSVTAVQGAEWAGLGIGGGGVIGLVSVFVLGKRGK